MIYFDFKWAIAAYFIIILSLCFLGWLFRKETKEKDLSWDPKFIWFCSVCTYTYINTREDVISTCPRCKSFNKKI